MKGISCLVLAPVMVATLAIPTLAQGKKGDLWETTSQMAMEGVPVKLPANTVKACTFKEWKEPPGAADKQRNCTTSNMKTVGNKVTWDTKCSNPTMTGTGELVREGPDAYTGSIKFTSAQGNMTINLKGKKVGDCDNPQ